MGRIFRPHCSVRRTPSRDAISGMFPAGVLRCLWCSPCGKVAQANEVNANLPRRWVRDFEQGLRCATPAPAGFMTKSNSSACKETSLDAVLQSDFIPVRFGTDSSAEHAGDRAPVHGPLDIQVRAGIW